MEDNVLEAASLEDNLNNQINDENLIKVKMLIEGKWQKIMVNNEKFIELMKQVAKSELDENNFEIGWFESREEKSEPLLLNQEVIATEISGDIEMNVDAPLA